MSLDVQILVGLPNAVLYGRRVVLNSEHKTRGGTVFQKGEILKVGKRHGGRLSLAGKNARFIRDVEVSDVHLLNVDFPLPEKGQTWQDKKGCKVEVKAYSTVSQRVEFVLKDKIQESDPQPRKRRRKLVSFLAEFTKVAQG